jgi:hypothetical protein
LQAKESLSALPTHWRQNLIENGNNQRPDRDFQQADKRHRNRRQREGFPVRLYIPEQSSKIAHLLRETLGLVVKRKEDGCKIKE